MAWRKSGVQVPPSPSRNLFGSDTSRSVVGEKMDPRISVAIQALHRLEHLEKQNKLKFTGSGQGLREIRAVLMACQWVEDFEHLKSETGKLNRPLDFRCGPKEEAMVRWCVNTIAGLSRRFRKGPGSSLLLGLDCALGTILTVQHLETNLNLCRVESSLGKFTIVTNMEVKQGGVLPLVVLPPQEVGGVMSEAMFVWGPVTSLADVDWAQVEGKV